MAVLSIVIMLLLFSISKVVDSQAAGVACGDSNTCNTGLTCESNFCRSGNVAQCKTGTTSDGSACRLNVGQTCLGLTTQCSSGSSCDTNNICKLNAGGDCSGNSAARCKSGTSCQSDVCITDNTYGGTCTTNGTIDSCVTPGGDVNAVCKDSKCACKFGYTGSIGAKCSGATSLASSLVILIAAIFVKTHLE